METARQTDNEQATLWNGSAGQAWVEKQEVLDRMFTPLEKLLVEAVSAAGASRVLDGGCGTGSTTLAVARLLGPGGRCTGIDISEPMLAAARARAERDGTPASFLLADAQTYSFEPASFDMMISRFGVMFFADSVQAFANLRRAAREDAGLAFIAWRSAGENPFMTTAERAAKPLLPNIPARQSDAPGQFAFADQQRVRRILEESGWAGIEIQPIDVVCAFPEKELIAYVTQFGPLGRIFHEMEEATRARVIDTVRPAFDPYLEGAEVRFTAACWMVRARATSQLTSS
jgi:ubiquinone/menaquinone biosynthesis C-methylase UbiE